jgi:uncharacterized protein YndB with AHSA1/START domain
MEKKTKIHAGEGTQDIVITRKFELPVELLFKAYVEPAIVAEWMNTNVLKLECRNHGGWQFETRDDKGNVVFRANGVIHEFVPDKKIVRTFQMENTPFPAQLEFLEFEKIDDENSSLKMHIVYRSAADRDQMLKLPFEYGLNMAHNKLQEILTQQILKKQ